MLGNEIADGFDYGCRVAEAVQDLAGHFGAQFGVAVESDAVCLLVGFGLGDVVEKNSPGEGCCWLVEAFEHKQRVGPDVAFGVEFFRLLDALHRFYLGEDLFEEVELVEEFEAAAGVGFGEDFG